MKKQEEDFPLLIAWGSCRNVQSTRPKSEGKNELRGVAAGLLETLTLPKTDVQFDETNMRANFRVKVGRLGLEEKKKRKKERQKKTNFSAGSENLALMPRNNKSVSCPGSAECHSLHSIPPSPCAPTLGNTHSHTRIERTHAALGELLSLAPAE